MENPIVLISVEKDFFNNTRTLEKFFNWLERYKKALEESMSSESEKSSELLKESENALEVIYKSAQPEVKKVLLGICNTYLNYDIAEHRAWIFLEYLNNLL